MCEVRISTGHEPGLVEIETNERNGDPRMDNKIANRTVENPESLEVIVEKRLVVVYTCRSY